MTIKTRINLLTATLMLLLAGASFLASQHLLHAEQKRYRATALNGNQVLWQALIENRLETMISAGRLLMRDKESLAALESGDREALARSARNSHILLSAEGIASSLILHDANGDIVYSAPEQISGGAGPLVRQAIASGKVQKGLQRNPAGHLEIVTATPLFVDGRIIGVGVYGLGLEPLLRQFRHLDGAEAFVTDTEGNIEYQTDTAIGQLIEANFTPVTTATMTTLASDKASVSIATLPLQDRAGNLLGYLVTTHDNTSMQQTMDSIGRTTAAVIVGLIGLSITLLTWLLHRAFRPLEAVVRVSTDIAAGNLETPIEHSGRSDETGRLLTAAKTMRDRLRHIVGEIRRSADHVRSLSAEIASANGELAQRTAEQASSLQETAASMDRVATASRRNADDAHTASKLAQEAMEKADEGAESMAATNQAVANISDRSRKIAEIVGLIDDIAFQTNLLALNASVEAARAGEQGKGFSVVAGEVRNLAERSAKAANEVKALVEETQRAITEGTRLAEVSATALTRMLHSVKSVHQLIDNIAVASEQQAAGIREINGTLTAIDTTTRENSSAVEETATASHALADEAAAMARAIAFFQLSETSAKTATPHPPDRHHPPQTPSAAEKGVTAPFVANG